MEDIFQILIFVAFAVLSLVPKLVKGKKEASCSSFPQTLIGEENVEDVSDEDENKFAQIKSVPFVMSERKEKKNEYRQEIKKKKINLSKKEEAKKAFIYSEIFKRKY